MRKLRNDASSPRIYQLSAQLPAGWNVSFKTRRHTGNVSQPGAGKTQDINIDIQPAMAANRPEMQYPRYVAVNRAGNAEARPEAVAKGSHKVELSTPTGRLSGDVTEGKRKEIHLVVKNTGTIALDNLELSLNPSAMAGFLRPPTSRSWSRAKNPE